MKNFHKNICNKNNIFFKKKKDTHPLIWKEEESSIFIFYILDSEKSF